MYGKIVFSLFFVLLVLESISQTSSEHMVWVQASEKLTINPSNSVTFLFQKRLFLERAQSYQHLYWLSFNHKFRGDVSLGGGAMYFTNKTRLYKELKSVPEFRPFQYMTIKRTVGVSSLNLRFMFEQRCLSITSQDAVEPMSRFEVRYRMRLTSTFRLADKYWLELSNEYFINGNLDIDQHFSQNRLTSLVKYKRGQFDLFAGYMHWLVNTSNGNETRHSWCVGIGHTFVKK